MITKEMLNFENLTYNELDQLITNLKEIQKKKKKYFEVTLRCTYDNPDTFTELIGYDVCSALKMYKVFKEVEIISVKK